MLLGEGVEMFTTGLQQDSSITQGGGVGLFTTGLAPAEGLPFSG
ncbi:hypothetical protein [Sulfitobacter faviae]|nr:hypothetical protein [Sulfitobacter faviae]